MKKRRKRRRRTKMKGKKCAKRKQETLSWRDRQTCFSFSEETQSDLLANIENSIIILSPFIMKLSAAKRFCYSTYIISTIIMIEMTLFVLRTWHLQLPRSAFLRMQKFFQQFGEQRKQTKKKKHQQNANKNLINFR